MTKRAPLIFLTVVLVVLLPFLVQIAWPFLTAFVLASILAIVVNPLKRWVSIKIHKPVLATFITTLATVFVLGGILVLAGFALTGELTRAYDALNRRSLEEGGWAALVSHAIDLGLDALAARVPVDKEAIRVEIFERMKIFTAFLLKNLGVALGGLTSILVTGLLVTIFLYCLLRYGEGWVERMATLIPLDSRTTASLFQTVKDSVVANVNGVLAVAAAQGLLLSIGFWFVGLRSPVLWGAVGGVASIIPILGCPLIWVPIVIAFVVNGSYGKALILTVWGALIVGSADNVLRPFVVGARVKQHPLLMALSMIGGTFAFGPLGILLGPLVVSLAIALVQEIQREVAIHSGTAAGQSPLS